MTRLAAVLAALAVAGCGGTDPAPTAQVYAVSICSCLPEQADRCIDVPNGSITCGPWGLLSNPTWTWHGSNSACPVPDCRMVGNRPASGECAIQVVCSDPLPAQ